jgi:tryptophan synthase alpha chain
VPAVIEAGADVIELGVPFSDPLADGATIQHAAQVALEKGVTLSTCLDVCAKLRARHPNTAFAFMGYYNPILAYGLERFAADAQKAGLDGVIVPDLPPEEAGPLKQACSAKGIDVIFLLAPTSTDRRIEAVARMASGFIYCVSLTGVTGARSQVPVELPEFIARVRKRTALPLAVGFGVSTADHVRTIGRVADAVIVGSALINAIDGDPAGQVLRVQSFVRELTAGTVKA